MSSSPLVSVMVWKSTRLGSKMIVVLFLAAVISARSEPGPLSAVVGTVSVLGSQRPSRAWSRRRKLGRLRGAEGVRPRVAAGEGFRFASQEENPMMLLLSGSGLRSSDNATHPGTQPERRGEGGPV